MTKTILLNRKSLLAKLFMLVMLLVGGGNNAWGDEYSFTFENKTLPTGWSSSGYSFPDNEVIQADYNSGVGGTLTSSQIDITSEQKIVIYIKGTSKWSAECKVKASLDNETYTQVGDFTNQVKANNDEQNYTYLTIAGNSSWKYLQITGKYFKIKYIKITSYPIMQVSPGDVTFGKATENKTQDYTISNVGAGEMDVEIVSDNSAFTVSKTSIDNIVYGTPQTFTLTFNYDAGSVGDKNANITVTPDGDSDKAITIVATARDPEAWEEDFSSGIPSSWYNQNGTWVTNRASHTGQAASGQNSSTKTDILRTPRLSAVFGQNLSFDVINASSSTYFLKAEYSTDRISWTTIENYTSSGTKTFIAPSTGYYWLRFTGYNTYVDNFIGFRLASNTHEMTIDPVIPTTGTQYWDYTVTANLLELGGMGETVNAELYFGDDKIDEITDLEIGSNCDETIELSFTPTTTMSGKVYVKVYNENINLQTDKVDVTISVPDLILDESNSTSWTSGTKSKLLVKYTPKSGWNTICMPFYLSTYMNYIFGTGWTAYALSSYDSETGTLTFEKANYPGSGTPYLVYIESPASHPNGVRINSISVSASTSANKVQKNNVTFQGTYVKVDAPGMAGKYGVTADGQIAKGGTGAYMKGYRAYLEGSALAGARMMVIEDDGESTDLGFVRMVDKDARDVYNLQGQKVQKGRKGLYVVNGKKVVIK